MFHFILVLLQACHSNRVHPGLFFGLSALLLCGFLPGDRGQILGIPVIKPDNVFFRLYDGGIDSVSISPDGKTAAFSGGNRPPLIMFDLLTQKKIDGLPDQKGSIRCTAFSSDGKTFATTIAGTAAWHDPTRIWHPSMTKILHELESPPPHVSIYLAYSPDSKLLATVETDNHVRLWDVQTGELVVTLPQQGVKKVWRVAFSPDGKTLATTNFDIVELHDLSGPTPLKDLQKQKPRLTLQEGNKGVRQLLFTPDSRVLITLIRKWVQLWDVQTGQIRQELDRAKKFDALAMALCPDGKLLAISCEAQHSELWNLGTGEQIAYLGPMAHMDCLAFSPDGRLLVTGARNGDVCLFKLPKQK